MEGIEFLRQKKDRLLEFLFKSSQKKILLAIEQNDLEALKTYFYSYKFSFAFLNKNKDTLLHIIARNNLAKFRHPQGEKKNEDERTHTNESRDQPSRSDSPLEKLDENTESLFGHNSEGASSRYECELQKQMEIVS